MDRVHSGATTALSHAIGLTRTQYALILLPGFIAGRLFDLGYFKRTMFISRSVIVLHNEYHLTTNSRLA